jgi:hypothetical protein
MAHSPSLWRKLLLSFCLIQTYIATINFTDTPILPTPLTHYERYVTFLAVGMRTYLCPTTSNSTTYALQTLDHNIYDVEVDPYLTTSLGKHVPLLGTDAEGGRSVFYTAVNTFTYW